MLLNGPFPPCAESLAVQESLFSCLGTEGSQTGVFLARLSYSALPGVDLPSLLTAWVGSTPPITVASTQLQADTMCPVVIDSLEPNGCNVNPPVDPPTDLPTNSSTDLLNNSTSDAIVIAVAVGVVVLLLMIVILAIAISTAVMVCCRKRSKYRYVSTDM